MNNLENMLGKTVYVTVSGSHFYKGKLLGYGAYGDNPNHKTFCVQVFKENGASFVDYFTRLYSEEEYQIWCKKFYDSNFKYRKLPVEIEAFRYDGDFVASNGKPYVPKWAVKALKEGIIYYSGQDEAPYELFIKTLEGDHHVTVGDFIIQGVKGELYSCKPDIFELTYEKVGELK